MTPAEYLQRAEAERRARFELQPGDVAFVISTGFVKRWREGRVERRTPKQVLVSARTGIGEHRYTRRFWLSDGSEVGAGRGYTRYYLQTMRPTDGAPAQGEGA